MALLDVQKIMKFVQFALRGMPNVCDTLLRKQLIFNVLSVVLVFNASHNAFTPAPPISLPKNVG